MKDKYLDNFEVCKLFQQCDTTVETPQSKCDMCKFLINQFNEIMLYTKDQPQNENLIGETFFENICYYFDLECQSPIFIIALKSFMASYLNQERILQICTLFKQC